MSEFVSPQVPQAKSVRSHMEETVHALVEVGQLSYIDTRVQVRAPYFREPLEYNSSSQFVELVDIYTAPPVPLAPKESVLNKFRDEIHDKTIGGSYGSSSWNNTIIYSSFTSNEKRGELSVTQKHVTETTVVVTEGKGDSSRQTQNTTDVQSREETHDISLLGQTSVKIYPSVRQAELGYQFDTDEITSLEYNAAVKKVQRQEFVERVKRKIGLRAKKQ